jgi:hypothetical protein
MTLSTFTVIKYIVMNILSGSEDQESQALIDEEDDSSQATITINKRSSRHNSSLMKWFMLASVGMNMVLSLAITKLLVYSNCRDPSLQLYCK